MPSVNENASGKEVARNRFRRVMVVALAMAGLAVSSAAMARSSAPYPDAAQKAEIDRLIVFYSKKYNVPVALARKVVQSESEYRPLARNGPYWGLMQIRYDTAKGMGFKGPPSGLLDAETNLAFGVAYLSNALKAAQGNVSRGHMLYRTGYYYEARRKRVLDEMILVRDFKPVGSSSPTVLAMAEMPEGNGDLWSGETAPAAKTASQAIAAAVGAPRPRARPVATTLVASADDAMVKPIDGKASAATAKAGATTLTASTLAPLPLAAPGKAGVKDPAVAQPTVVYASVLPLSRPVPLAKPAEPIAAPGIVPDAPAAVASADAADMPTPRPKPVVAAVADANEPPPSPLQLALNAAAARKGAELAAAAAAASAALPGATGPVLRSSLDAAAPMVVAAHSVPLPRARPVVSE